MRNRIMAALALIAALALGFCLPSVTSLVQDQMHLGNSAQYALPAMQGSVAQENAMSLGGDTTYVYVKTAPAEGNAMDSFQAFLEGGQHLLLDSATVVDVTSVQELAQEMIDWMLKTGIMENADIAAVSVSVVLSTSYIAPGQTMTLWEYTAKMNGGDELVALIDVRSGKAMRIVLRTQYVPALDQGDLWSRWQTFFQMYYELSDVRMEQESDSRCIYTFENPEKGIRVDLPLEVLELTVSGDGQPVTQYRFNY